MAILTNGQYARLQAAKKAGDMKLYESIMNEAYGEDGTVLEAEIEIVEPKEIPKIELPDAETINDKLASGMTKAEVGKEYGISPQKIGSILRSGGE